MTFSASCSVNKHFYIRVYQLTRYIYDMPISADQCIGPALAESLQRQKVGYLRSFGSSLSLLTLFAFLTLKRERLKTFLRWNWNFIDHHCPTSINDLQSYRSNCELVTSMAVLPPQGITSRILVQSPSTIHSKHTTCFYCDILTWSPLAPLGPCCPRGPGCPWKWPVRLMKAYKGDLCACRLFMQT